MHITKDIKLTYTTMTLKELIFKTAYADVAKEMIAINPADMWIHGIEYQEVFGKLLAMVPRESTLILDLADENVPIPYFHTDDPDDEASFDLSLDSWSIWLGAEVDDIALEEFSPARIIACALFEMTTYGFDEKTIAREAKKNGYTQL